MFSKMEYTRKHKGENMRQLYIDFDGVILDTIPKAYKELKENNIDKKDAEKVNKFFEKLDWFKTIEETKQINNSIEEIIKICNSKKFNVYVLTHVNSLNEMVAKIRYLHNHLPEITVVSVPKAISKTEVVNASGAILIDDFEGNIKDWQKKCGIGIKFVKTPENSQYPEISFLSEIIDLFN